MTGTGSQPICPPSPTSTSSVSSRRLGEAANYIRAPLDQELPESTLHQRIGGDTVVRKLTDTFYDIAEKTDALKPFFLHVPIESKKAHLVLFLKVIFGTEEEQPSADRVFNFMIKTHVRLFRSLGLNGGHYDVFVDRFEEAMSDCDVPQSLQEEILTILLPLRAAFDYGSEVAKEEKSMSREEYRQAPTASASLMKTQAPIAVKLPSGVKAPPRWLVALLGDRETVRAWTCELTNRFTVQDPVLSKTFMAVPYLQMETYCHAFLQFAFASTADAKCSIRTLRELRFPCGLTQSKIQVNKEMFDHMVEHLYQSGYQLSLQGLSFLDEEELHEIKESLLEHRGSFIGEDKSSGIQTEPQHYTSQDHSSSSDPMDRQGKSLKEELNFSAHSYDQLKMQSQNHLSKKVDFSKTAESTKQQHDDPTRKHSFLWFRRRTQRTAKSA